MWRGINPTHEGSREHDHDIAERLRAGDEGALEIVFLEYYVRLCTFASSYVISRGAAEDLVSDVFARLWAGRASFAPDGPIEAYLFRAVRNRAADYARDERRLEARHTAAANAGGGIPGAGEGPPVPDAVFDEDERAAALWRAIAALPPQRRAIMILRWQQGKSFAEIADAMGMSRPAVQMQVGRAVKALRSALRDLSGL